MEATGKVGQPNNTGPERNRVHRILAHSYFFYFMIFLLALFLDFVFPLKVFHESGLAYVGVLFLVLGPLLIFWAQISSHKLKKENMNRESFCNGPYRYTRGPTNFGIFILILGFGITANALFVVVFALISFIITRFTFIRKEEKILAEKYGAPYVEYKKLVKF